MSANQLDPVRDGRSPSEVLFKTLAIYVTTTGAVGHLTSLRKISDSHRAVAEAEVLGFLIYPTLPIASTLYHTWKTAQLWLRHRRGPSSRQPRNGIVSNAIFYASACLGARAIFSRDGTEQLDGADSALLHQIAFSDRITSKTRKYDMRWLGRLVLLTALLVQAIATSILGIRRCLHVEALTATDVRNMYLALGGSWAEVVAIALTCINRDWCFDRGAHDAFFLDTANRYQLLLHYFDGIHAFRSSDPAIIIQLSLASWILRIVNLLHVLLRQQHARTRLLEAFLLELYGDDFSIVMAAFMLFHPLVPLVSVTFWSPLVPFCVVLLAPGTRHRLVDTVYDFFAFSAVLWDVITALCAVLWLVMDLRRISRARETGIWNEALWQDAWATFLWAF